MNETTFLAEIENTFQGVEGFALALANAKDDLCDPNLDIREKAQLLGVSVQAYLYLENVPSSLQKYVRSVAAQSQFNLKKQFDHFELQVAIATGDTETINEKFPLYKVDNGVKIKLSDSADAGEYLNSITHGAEGRNKPTTNININVSRPSVPISQIPPQPEEIVDAKFRVKKPKQLNDSTTPPVSIPTIGQYGSGELGELQQAEITRRKKGVEDISYFQEFEGFDSEDVVFEGEEDPWGE